MPAYLNELVRAVSDALPEELSDIAASAKELSLAFTSGRASMGRDYFAEPEMLDAYCAAFLLPNAAKVVRCMEAIALPKGKDALSILDLGTGPGTAVLAASLYLAHKRPDLNVSFAGMERSREALARAHDLFRRTAPPNHSFESAVARVGSRPLGTLLGAHRFDIVIAANLLNELPYDEATKLCREILDERLYDGGTLIVIDPALRETTRPLMKLRDELMADGDAGLLAPCLHRKPCPMLSANDRDWCHFYVEWERPEYLVELDRLSGMDHTHLKMAYFVFAKEKVRRSTSDGPRLWRVVSSPIVSKGKRELFLCGETGMLRRMTRLDRNASGENEAFTTAARGDLVMCADVDRVSKDDAFEIEASFEPDRRPSAAR